MLKRYKDTHKQLNTTINTFGFGYSIDTPLLLNIAVEGHGMHAFIPDASFVGTAFINSISNLLVCLTPFLLSQPSKFFLGHHGKERTTQHRATTRGTSEASPWRLHFSAYLEGYTGECMYNTPPYKPRERKLTLI